MKKGALLGSLAATLTGVGIRKYFGTLDTPPVGAWTRADIPDLSGVVIIVTGANSGIGYEAAKAFAGAGAQTILACRNLGKAQAALDQIRAETPAAAVEILQIDLANLGSVRRFAHQFKAKYHRLDVLLNNAGVMIFPYGTTQDGFERMFGTNHLGHFALTGLLIDPLIRTPGSRVVNISSIGHGFGRMDFDNLMFASRDGYAPLAAYGRSKLANLLFTYELQSRFEAAGANSIAVAAHPGFSDTNLIYHIFKHWHVTVLRPILGWVAQDQTMAALPGIRAAVDPNVTGGEYFGPHGPFETRGYPVLVSSNAASHNLEDAKRLWQVSEELTGVHYLDRPNQGGAARMFSPAKK